MPRILGETIAETGFWWGEVTALQPRDLRRRSGRPAIRVQRAWKKDEDGKSVFGPPKTLKSCRTIVITHTLDRMLLRRAQGLAPNALMFTGPEGGKWDPGAFCRLRWIPAIEPAAEKFGLIKRPRFHDLRHSCASVADCREGSSAGRPGTAWARVHHHHGGPLRPPSGRPGTPWTTSHGRH
ncbi:site-specific integrase [Streptomyces brevispora]|uniref:hypothetical protein n=1 Tax=Streptomyces brevispora TaxID=887462 RepID=UPI00380E4C31